MVTEITDAGRALLMRALAGETLTFSKIKIGNGTAQTASTATNLENPQLTVDISEITTDTNFVTLSASFNNSDITAGFKVTELGIFAEDPDNDTETILYAIGYEAETVADYVPANTVRIMEMQFEAKVYVGTAESVTAEISSSLVYASKSDFDAHTAAENNPHNVTAAQVGLGNVPNVSANGLAPEFSEPAELANISSGEIMSVLMGKIKRAITGLIGHIADRNNPHNVTAEQIHASYDVHTHAAADINKGILPAERGGTGQVSITALADNLCQNGIAASYMMTYTGTGTANKTIWYPTGRGRPKMVVLQPVSYYARCAVPAVLTKGAEHVVVLYADGNNNPVLDNIIVQWTDTAVSLYPTIKDDAYNTASVVYNAMFIY